MTGCRSRLAAGPLLLLTALALQPMPAAAENSFLDSLFGRKEEPKAEPAPAPAEEAAPAQSAKKATGQKAAKDKSAASEKSAKPSAKAASTPSADAPRAASPTATGSLANATPEAVVERANAYFNGFQTLTGNFMQIGADGRKIGGKLYLAKPGRLRFAYDEPSPLEVVADGTSVAVRDRKLNTQDVYFISQTPLKFLIRDKVNLASDLDVTDVSNDPGGVRVSLEDRSTLGGTSKIQLFFDADMKTLSQWRITDPQGYLTTVQLSNLQKGKAVDGTLFFINYGRPEDKAMAERIRRGEAQAQ